MEVQIFMSEDNKALIYDNDQLTEFNSLVSELGLKCDNHIDKHKSPIPYLWLDEATVRAFQIICPTAEKIEKYRFEIPIEILRNVKLANTEKYFDWIEIWSNTKDPDPFCIGRVYKDDDAREKKYHWNASYYLIGRWGSEGKPVNELVKDAIKIASHRILTHASTTIAKMSSWKSCPEDWARNYIFNNDSETREVISKGGNAIDYELPF